MVSTCLGATTSGLTGHGSSSAQDPAFPVLWHSFCESVLQQQCPLLPIDVVALLIVRTQTHVADLCMTDATCASRGSLDLRPGLNHQLLLLSIAGKEKKPYAGFQCSTGAAVIENRCTRTVLPVGLALRSSIVI
jgi:hypothetical protein